MGTPDMISEIHWKFATKLTNITRNIFAAMLIFVMIKKFDQISSVFEVTFVTTEGIFVESTKMVDFWFDISSTLFTIFHFVQVSKNLAKDVRKQLSADFQTHLEGRN